ncbi:MAG: Maf family nucleotide pyrophosphatase [Actinomycetota bacterium]|nr:Maf family nucleotide pyrophosphatase [Actinomycetota bacterium]
MDGVRLVLASASSGRLATLRAAGLDPEVVPSGVDEDRVGPRRPAELARTLAMLKCGAVAGRLGLERPTVVLGCDSVLEIDGAAHGKPGDAAAARRRWRSMRGRAGVLHSGLCVRLLGDGPRREEVGVGSTTVHFADVSDDEIDAYVATGEPLGVAGAFTLDGLGGPFVERIEGDPSNVVGISLPLLRRLLLDLGVAWPSLWR